MGRTGPFFTRATLASAVLDIERWLSSGSPIILVFLTLAPIPNSKGNPFSGVLNTQGWGKFAIYDLNCRLSRKWCKIGRWFLWNVNRKSWVPYRMASFSMTLSDL